MGWVFRLPRHGSVLPPDSLASEPVAPIGERGFVALCGHGPALRGGGRPSAGCQHATPEIPRSRHARETLGGGIKDGVDPGDPQQRRHRRGAPDGSKEAETGRAFAGLRGEAPLDRGRGSASGVHQDQGHQAGFWQGKGGDHANRSYPPKGRGWWSKGGKPKGKENTVGGGEAQARGRLSGFAGVISSSPERRDEPDPDLVAKPHVPDLAPPSRFSASDCSLELSLAAAGRFQPLPGTLWLQVLVGGFEEVFDSP